jgi:pyridine nucleotide-disulfide oxidoreductase family protein
VLEALAREPLPDIRVTLVTPYRTQIYSGMLPGWVAGHYRFDECGIPLDKLAVAAGAALLCTHVRSIDANAKRVHLRGGDAIDYDFLVVDIGSAIRTDTILGEPEHVVPVRPAQNFATRYRRFVGENLPGNVAVVGAGMGSFEIACAISHSLGHRNAVTLFAGRNGLVPSLSRVLRTRLLGALGARGVNVVNEDIRRTGKTHVETPDGKRFVTSLVILATGPQAPQLLRDSTGLELDEQGYLKVDRCLRSHGHPELFAAGDCVSLPFPKIAKSGVYAVRQGPILAHNVRAAITQNKLQRFRPQRRTLYLMSTGEQNAVGAWGPFWWEGKWVWKWKDRIDRKFVQRFRGGRQ